MNKQTQAKCCKALKKEYTAQTVVFLAGEFAVIEKDGTFILYDQEAAQQVLDRQEKTTIGE